jgi:hypothetical protein
MRIQASAARIEWNEIQNGPRAQFGVFADAQRGTRAVAMISLYIDADACPVKREVYRVAERHARRGTALKVDTLTPRRHGRTCSGHPYVDGRRLARIRSK